MINYKFYEKIRLDRIRKTTESFEFQILSIEFSVTKKVKLIKFH